MTPEIDGESVHTVQLTDQGIVPSVLAVEAGSVIEFVNMDLAGHRIAGAGWDSGLLRSGESYRIKPAGEGVETLVDAQSSTTITLQVGPEVDEPGEPGAGPMRVYLPMVVNR